MKSNNPCQPVDCAQADMGSNLLLSLNFQHVEGPAARFNQLFDKMNFMDLKACSLFLDILHNGHALKLYHTILTCKDPDKESF